VQELVKEFKVVFFVSQAGGGEEKQIQVEPDKVTVWYPV